MSASSSPTRDSLHVLPADPTTIPLPLSPTSIPEQSLESMLEEAIDTALPPASSITPISPLPQAHYSGSSMSHNVRPRLLSQITRSTLPTSSLVYAQQPHAETSAAARRRASEMAFPDLDPMTGLPPDMGSVDGGSGNGNCKGNGLQLQRTITGLLKSPTQMSPGMTFPSVGLPKMPALPSMPGIGTGMSRQGSTRSMSSSSAQSDWGWGWWGGNKSKVDRMMSEEDQGETVEEEQEKHKRKYRTPKHPMVFCHGLLGFDYLGPTSLPPLQISHWRGIREVLESNGVDVLITRVPATASVADRAAILAETIAEKYEGQEVNLIGHSMGGLDCRYLVGELKPTKFKVISVTTVSTPHRGSPFADYLIDNIVGRERLPSLLGMLEAFRLPQTGDGSAFESLGTKSMKAFNAQVVDDPDVKYYSWGASFEPGLLDTFKWPHSVILAKEGPNDGLVSVQSAQWGEYRGTLLDVNHLDLVGWVNHVRYAFAGWAGKPITFKPATFYLEISDYLAEQGF